MHLWTYLIGGLYMVSSLFRFSEYAIRAYDQHRDHPLEKKMRKRFYEYLYSTLHSICITSLASLSYQKNLFQVHDLGSYRVNEGMKLTMGVAFAYFLLDLFQCQSRMYVVHHLCALQLIGSSMTVFEERPYRASYLMGMLALFEWNTPLFNLGFLCRDLNLHYTVLGSVWSLNLILYSLSRLIMIPMLLYYYHMHGDVDKNKNIDKNGFEWMDWIDGLSLSIIYGGSFYWAIRQTQGIAKKVLPRIGPGPGPGPGPKPASENADSELSSPIPEDSR